MIVTIEKSMIVLYSFILILPFHLLVLMPPSGVKDLKNVGNKIFINPTNKHSVIPFIVIGPKKAIVSYIIYDFHVSVHQPSYEMIKSFPIRAS